MKAKGVQYVVYYRVSTKGQGESGLGLAGQKAMINSFLSPDQIAGEFTEVISAKVLPSERPQLAAAIEYAKQNGCGLAVAKVDRLSRVTEHALSIYQEMKGFLFSCDIPMTAGAAMDKFTLTIYMAIADRERELIGIRTKAALAEIKKDQAKGKKRYDKDGNLKQKIGSPENLTSAAKAKALATRKANALNNEAWIQAAFEATARRDKGMSFQAIADELNRKGFTTRRGKSFQPTTVKRLIAKGLE